MQVCVNGYVTLRPVQHVSDCDCAFLLMAQEQLRQEPRYRRDHRAMRSKSRYLSKFTAASRGFHCDSNAFELNNNINHVIITV